MIIFKNTSDWDSHILWSHTYDSRHQSNRSLWLQYRKRSHGSVLDSKFLSNTNTFNSDLFSYSQMRGSQSRNHKTSLSHSWIKPDACSHLHSISNSIYIYRYIYIYENSHFSLTSKYINIIIYKTYHTKPYLFQMHLGGGTIAYKPDKNECLCIINKQTHVLASISLRFT